MVNQSLRELMRQAYYLLDDFEKYTGADDYWDKLRIECESFCARWSGNMRELAFAQAAAIWDFLEKESKKPS